MELAKRLSEEPFEPFVSTAIVKRGEPLEGNCMKDLSTPAAMLCLDLFWKNLRSSLSFPLGISTVGVSFEGFLLANATLITSLLVARSY